MGNYNPGLKEKLADLNVGLQVDKAAISIAGASTKDIFTVTGGRVLVRQLVGEVTIATAATASNGKFVSTPTVGLVANMCAAADIASIGIGGMCSLPGISITTAMNVTTTTATGVIGACAGGVVVAAGTIGFNTSGNSTGTMKFSIWYLPIDDGAYVTSA